MLLKRMMISSLLMIGASAAVHAQTAGDPSIQIDDATASPGDTGTILPGAFTNDSGGVADIAVAGQFDVVADAGLTVQGQASDGGGGWVDCPTTQFPEPGITVSCSEPAAQTTRYVLEQGANNPLPDATDWFRFSVDVGAAVTPGALNLTITNDGYADADANDMPPATFGGNNDNGVITVEAPAGAGFYASTPAPGDVLALGAAVVGDTTTPAVNLNVQNPSPDTPFDVTAFDDTGDTQLNTPAAGVTVPFGDNVDFPFDCTPTARGAQDGDFTVAHDAGGGATSPVTYSFTCAGLAPNVQVPAGPVAINGLTIDPNPLTATFDVTNSDDTFTSDASNVTASAAGDAQITVAPAGPVTIATDGMQTYTVSCDNTAPGGNFTSTITITWDDPSTMSGSASDTIAVTCDVIDEIAEYESDPAIGSTLDFGAVLNGDTSAPLGVDIGNTDTGGPPNATLTISGATIAGADAAVFTLVTDPTGDTFAADTAPDGTPDAEVTCTPTDGFSTFTATLSIESNDPDDSPAEYPLTCDGDTDAALESDPAPGTVSLGTIGPGGSADTTITLTNTGTSGDITLDSCTLTADPEITLVSPTAFPVAIAPGASTDIVLNCTPGSPGTFTGTLACEASDVAGTLIPLDYDLVCSGQAVEVPTLSRTGLLAMIMALMAVGFIGFRLRQN